MNECLWRDESLYLPVLSPRTVSATGPCAELGVFAYPRLVPLLRLNPSSRVGNGAVMRPPGCGRQAQEAGHVISGRSDCVKPSPRFGQAVRGYHGLFDGDVSAGHVVPEVVVAQSEPLGLAHGGFLKLEVLFEALPRLRACSLRVLFGVHLNDLVITVCPPRSSVRTINLRLCDWLLLQGLAAQQ